IHAHYSRALNAILGDKEEEAKEALAEILKEDPEHLDALLRLGDIALSNEDFQAAFDYYKKARDINHSDLHVLLSIETVMEKMKRFDDSMKYIDEILDIDAGTLPPFAGSGRYSKCRRNGMTFFYCKNRLSNSNKTRKIKRERTTGCWDINTSMRAQALKTENWKKLRKHSELL